MNLEPTTRITTLRTQYPAGLLGLPGDDLLLSWQLDSATLGAVQLGYRIEVASDRDFANIIADSGPVSSDQQLGIASPARNLVSRETQFFRVAVNTNLGWTSWSQTLACEAGLLSDTDWHAQFIGDSSLKESPSPILRNEIFLRDVATKARLYVTSMGINDVFINGIKVGETFLNPGWTTYHQRLLVETHDVTDLLNSGKNCLAGVLSDGWWRGNFGFMGQSEHYGKTIGLLAQLEVTYPDGSIERFGTDEAWQTSTGEIRFSSIYDGSTLDFNQAKTGWNRVGYDAASWDSVVRHKFDFKTLAPRITNSVVKVAEFPMEIEPQQGRVLLRGVQNISGWVKLEIDGRKGQSIVVRHAEVLEPGDLLHTKALRSAKATDTYVLDRDGRFTLEPVFTFHGFQHADVVTEAAILSATAVAISSDNPRRGVFECSDPRINRLHENVVWSQLDNFVSIPTDCPQRDERMGWTGDAQAFCNTANTLFDTTSFWRSWLIDLQLEQFENGDVSAVVPDIIKPYPDSDGWISEGRAGWGDAATIIPMSVYEFSGDESILKQQLISMRRWVSALDNRRAGAMFLPTQFQFGDWCDPDAPGNKPWLSKVSADFVANSFFCHSAMLLSQAERIVGDEHLAKKSADLASELRENIWSHFGDEATKTSTGCSILLEFDLAPPSSRQPVADKLAELVTRSGGMITSGFLGTPLVLHALSKNNHVESAYTMLMRSEFRSWLYAVDKGATTIWERWDAIREDGSIHSGSDDASASDSDSSMISFNHYAYGAVVDWIYRNLAGISPVEKSPGFRKVLVAPKPPRGVRHANGSIECPYGHIGIKWIINSNDEFEADLVLPFGVTATLDLPTKGTSTIWVNGSLSETVSELGYGTHKIVVSDPKIIEY